MIENPPPESSPSPTPFDASVPSSSTESSSAGPVAPGSAPSSTSTPASTPASFAAASFEHEVAQQEAVLPTNSAVAASESAAASTSPSVSTLSAADDPTDDTAAEAPRALAPGTLLQGDCEIKEVMARGLTNLYRADTGGYGPSQPWLIAERELRPEPPVAAPGAPQVASQAAPVKEPVSVTNPEAAASTAVVEEPEAAVEEPEATASAPDAAPAPEAEDSTVPAAPEIPLSELARSSGMGLTDQGEFEHAGQGGGLSSESGVYDAPIEIMAPREVAPSTLSSPHEPEDLYLDPEPLQPVHLRPAEAVHLDLVQSPSAPQTSQVPVPQPEEDLEDVPSLLMPGEVWEQDGRQYCAWEWAQTTSLQDFRDSTNDERYFQVLGRVAEAMAWQKARGRVLELNRDTLRFDATGRIHFYGFSSPLQDESELLNQLRGVNEFLLKHTFANSGTMRLDDPFAGLPLTEETKAFAHKLGEGEFASFEAAHASLQVLAGTEDLEMSVALITDVGQQRELNEDSGLIARCARKTMLSPLEWELLVVADGMGGHEGGEIASDLTVRVLHQQFLEARWDWKDNAAVRAGLLAAIMATNARVAALAEEPKYKGSRSRPGSTLTFVVRAGRRLWIGNVGDSRTYLFRDNQLQRVTKDHSYVQNLIDAGAITEEEAWDHPDGSIITAHIGEANLKTRDVFMRLLQPGDKLLLVSDGVVDMLRDSEIAPFLQQAQPGAICRSLVNAANAAGGADNITALCLCCY